MADTNTSGEGQQKRLIELLPDWHPIAKSYKQTQAAKNDGPSTEPKLPSATYRGGCHCGAISYDVTLSPPLEPVEGSNEPGHTVIDCSCSVCRRFGYLLVYPSKDNVVFHNKGGGQARCKKYQFNLRLQDHLFCKNCGSSVMIDFLDRFDPDWHGFGINVRSLYDVDLEKLNVHKVDGKNGVAPAGDMSGQWYVESDTEE
ncbi:hypothetical protein Sste5346_001815 [Sporothrix stenoceras]|uniref:CENP-V/GFA domain-containing protein n=1 Tax=Sporothrix stenoceras TaxID=5173 RepID=A0ABR3ZMV8_9PEZI